MPALTRHLRHWPDGVPHHLSLPDHSIHENLARTAACHPQRPALIFHGATLSYSDLLARVEALAGTLQNLGVRRGDRVLLYMQNSPQFIIGYYAILRADAVVIPVNPMNRHAELEHLARDTGARVALAGSELLNHITPLIKAGGLDHVIAAAYADMADVARDIPLPDPLDSMSDMHTRGPGVIRWTDALSGRHAPAPHCAGPDDLAVIPYSSGTTGQPKGCMHSHRTVMVTALGSVVWNPIDENSVNLATLPLFHVTGMQACMNGPIMVGGTIVVMTRWDRATAAALIARHRVTRWRSISTMAIDLVNDPDFDSYDLSSLEAIGGGGAAMPEAIAKRLRGMTGLDYIEGYGLSETMAATHINPVTAPRQQCLGIPVFDVDSRVISTDNGHELGPGEVGEIITHAPQVFLGYWNRPKETEKAFLELDGKAFFHTGDLGYYDEDGYFYMVDRVKRMINASGFKVWPAEVEALMHHNPDIAEVCVIGAQDPRRGETVKAYVVPSPAAQGTVSEKDIIEWCRAEMAAYKCPRTVAFVDSLPKSGAGKILWRQLADAERVAAHGN
ncbi:MAG: AMP-binding protein [Sediminimonas qiaohouensis]|uniref:AMP-binding protein n=1 Tax=Sediminimonas qiaohouensis TaxID=552061 RepID=A0A7C9HJ10_9RHOB|nr:long-chain-fatty-acid--CoA ligase [Sediminimonas qiaohouensis]MTJ04592.1 AMP-binding protein [Sediminimonas qiaohouensis]